MHSLRSMLQVMWEVMDIVLVFPEFSVNVNMFVHSREARREESRIRQTQSHCNNWATEIFPNTPCVPNILGTVKFGPNNIHLSLPKVLQPQSAR